MLVEKVTDGLLYMEANINHSPPFKENYELCYIMSSEMHTECPLLPGITTHCAHNTQLAVYTPSYVLTILTF